MKRKRKRVFYHVTERKFVADISRNGFRPGGGSAGSGTYLFEDEYLANDWIEGHFGQGGYRDPVILEVKTSEYPWYVPDYLQLSEDDDDRQQLFGHYIIPHKHGTRWIPDGGVKIYA